MADAQQLPYLLELLDDETPLVRQAVVRELSSFGSRIYEELNSLPIEIPPKDKTLLNTVLESPRRIYLKRQWPYWFGLPDDRERLEAAMTFLAEYQSGLEFQGKLKGMLDAIAEEYRGKYRTSDAHTLAEFLFKDKSFVGAHDDYYNPQNSNLIYVIKQRKGIPISLSCVYMLVGWRLGLNIRGCNSPRHFLTIVERGSARELVDCFHAGKVVGEKEIVTLSRETSLSIEDALKLEADAVSIVRRVLGNLIFAYQQVEREKDSLLMVHLLKEVQLYQDQSDRAQSDSEEFGIPQEVALYNLGQKIQHVDEGYRGIVVDYDLYCINDKNLSDDEDAPDNNQPWYKIFVHGTDRVLYVPHSQIIQDHSKEDIKNPLVSCFFIKTDDGVYVRNNMPWLD